MKTRVIVPVAGKGKRFSTDIPKQFFHLAGTPVIVHTVSKFIASPLIIGGVIVFSEEDIVKYSHILKNVDGFSDKFEIISGGEHRQDSVYNGIQALPTDTEIVLVHDGVRPFIDDGLISRCIQGGKENDACIAAIPANDTIKQVKDGMVVATLFREELWHAQTPQAFRYKLLKQVHEKAKKENYYSTDEASLIEWAGYNVHVVDGHRRNIKITTKEDLKLAEIFLSEMEN